MTLVRLEGDRIDGAELRVQRDVGLEFLLAKMKAEESLKGLNPTFIAAMIAKKAPKPA
jgi:hypothetical protein